MVLTIGSPPTASPEVRASFRSACCGIVDADLRRRRIKEIAKLTHPVLHDCWKDLMKVYPCGAGTVRTLERYLIASGLIADGRQETINSVRRRS